MEILKFVLLISVGPAIFLMNSVYKKDKIEKEPMKLLVKLGILGALSGIPACFLEYVMENFTGDDVFLQAFIGIALVEEGLKFLTLYLFTWRRKEFNYRFDGIVYAVFVSLGFAAFENFFYVLLGGISVAIARALISVPGHMVFGIFMGIYYGEAKLCDSNISREKEKNIFLAVAVPVLLHGFFDYCLLNEKIVLTIVFFVFIAILFITAKKKIDYHAKNDVKLVEEESEANFDEMKEDETRKV